MSLPVVVFPDVEADAIGYLAAELGAGVRVGSRWPEDLAANLPVVALSRGGGAVAMRFVLEDVTLDIDVLAVSKAQARALASQVRGLLFAAEGRTLGATAVRRVDDVSMIWLPEIAAEGVESTARYVLVMNLRVRPA